MPKINQILLKTFAQNAVGSNDVTQFGSFASVGPGGTPTNDPAVIQGLPAYESGFTASGLQPEFREVNGLLYRQDEIMKYLFQEGIPEYLSTRTYYQNSIVKEAGTYKLYGSKTDDNVGNALNDTANWEFLVELGADLGFFPTNKVVIANNGSDPNNDIDFSQGSFVFSDNTGRAILSAITKQLDAVWAEGTNQGGLDTGSKANSTWYACYAIYNSTSEISDAIFSTNTSSPSLPSGYTKYRKIGYIRTNGSGDILGFTQIGNHVMWSTPVLDFSGATTSLVLQTITVPSGINVKASLRGQAFRSSPAGVYSFNIWSPLQTGATVSTTVCLAQSGSSSSANANAYFAEIITNTSSQVYRNGNIDTTTIYTYGWEYLDL